MLINNTITLNINSIVYCKPAKAYKFASKLTANILAEYNKNIINIIYFFITIKIIKIQKKLFIFNQL